MGNVKITDMTAAGSADGTELLATSKAAAPRSLTVAKVKDYVIDQVEAISAGTVVDGTDKVYILDATDSALKPVDVDLVAQHAIDTIWAKAAESSPDGADVMALKDGATEKTVTLTVLAEYVRSAIEATILDVSDLADGSGALAVTDYMLVTQGTTAKQVTVQDIYTAIYTGLAAQVASETGVGAGDIADELYLVRSGNPFKITLDQISDYVLTNADLSGTGTTDFLAQWSDTNVLAAGPEITDSVDGFAAGSDTAVPTTAVVRDEMDEIVNDATDIADALADADEFLVYDTTAAAQKKSALSRLWTWIKTKTDAPLAMLDIDGATDVGALANADLIIVDDGGVGSNKSATMANVYNYIAATNGTVAVGWPLPNIAVASLPAASGATANVCYCSNGAAGSPVLAFSDGTNWLRCDTLGAVSAS